MSLFFSKIASLSLQLYIHRFLLHHLRSFRNPNSRPLRRHRDVDPPLPTSSAPTPPPPDLSQLVARLPQPVPTTRSVESPTSSLLYSPSYLPSDSQYAAINAPTTPRLDLVRSNPTTVATTTLPLEPPPLQDASSSRSAMAAVSSHDRDFDSTVILTQSPSFPSTSSSIAPSPRSKRRRVDLKQWCPDPSQSHLIRARSTSFHADPTTSNTDSDPAATFWASSPLSRTQFAVGRTLISRSSTFPKKWVLLHLPPLLQKP